MKTGTIRYLRKWFIEYQPDMHMGEPIIGGRGRRVKTFRSTLQYQDENGEWKDVPYVDDEASLEEARKR